MHIGRAELRPAEWLQSLTGRLARIPLPVVLGGLTVLIVTVGILLVQNSISQRIARDRVVAEAQAQMAIRAVLMSLSDAESGQRGFLLTRSPGALEPFRAAQRRLPAEIKQLRLLVSSSEMQDAGLQELERLVSERLNEMEMAVNVANTGDREALDIILRSDGSAQTMATLRRGLEDLSANQRTRSLSAVDAAWRADRWQVPLLVAMWLVLMVLVWGAVRGERLRAAAEAEAAQAPRLRELSERNELLARELDHRVKNMFSVILALIRMAQRGEPAGGAVAGLGDRVQALSRAHGLILAAPDGEMTDLDELLSTLLSPYRTVGDDRIAIEGTAVSVARTKVTPLCLIVHELATNSSKYGALSHSDGRLNIAWQAADGVVLTWSETGRAEVVADETQGSGFGSRMIDGAIRQLGGTIERNWRSDGLDVELRFKAG